MTEDDLSNEIVGSKLSGYRLVVVSLVASLATFLIATVYPSDRVVDETMKLSFGASYAWVASQSFLLTIPGLLLGLLMARILPRVGALVGSLLIFMVPVVVFCDVVTFAWIGERFLSDTMRRIVTTLLPVLKHHITRNNLIDAGIVISIAMVTVAISWRVSGWIARRWAESRDAVRPTTTMLCLSITAMVVSTPVARNLSRTLSEMQGHSTRHPFCAFHLVGYRGVGDLVPQGEKAVLPRLRGLQAAEQVKATDRRHATVAIDPDTVPAASRAGKLRDIVVIVIESMRHEVVDPEVMPNLYAFAQRSIYCKNHFSAGNSTVCGFFGLLNGLEDVWFDRPVWSDPIMNRLLHQAGYELAFHGGEDDWPEANMDGFINKAHFDQFIIEYPELLETDYRAVQRTSDFIAEGKKLAKKDPQTYRPRLGMTYLLASHAPYLSEPEDQVFQPAASQTFLFPYTASAVPGIKNRYKNSARTVDRMIQPLLRDDCIVIVAGDHGESFLEDGSSVHGLRLSKIQNMTPMILYYPGVEPRVIQERTTHTDILPTLLSILGLAVTDRETFDGCDLTSVKDDELRERIFVTSNLIDHSRGLIGPWTDDPTLPFAYRFVCSLGDWQVGYLNPVDEFGYELPDEVPENDLDGRQLVRDWLIRKIGSEIVREDLSEAELFEKFFNSDDREIRMSVLQIARQVTNPDSDLYELISKAAGDEDPEIRELAKELVIRHERFIGRN